MEAPVMEEGAVGVGGGWEEEAQVSGGGVGLHRGRLDLWR